MAGGFRLRPLGLFVVNVSRDDALEPTEQNEVDLIISRDEEAFTKSTIRRLSTREYVEIFCEETPLP